MPDLPAAASASTASLASRLSRLAGGAGCLRAAVALVILLVFFWLEFRSLKGETVEHQKLLEAGMALLLTSANVTANATEE
jgi:hypothetical protein